MDCPEANEFRVVQPAPLTLREAEVLLWTAEGKTAWEAGRILGITEGTARARLAHALDKLRASNKPHAVARAFAVGIIARKIVVMALMVSGCIVSPDSDASRVPRRPVARAARCESLAGFNGRF
ncbi:luxR family regulatory protein [Bordetella phage PY223]